MYRSKIKNSWRYFFVLIALFGCGKDENKKTLNTLGGLEYVVVDSGTLAFETNSVSGTGSIVFNSPLSQVSSKNSYRVTFSLEEGGSVSLVANSTNKLANGVNFNFTRNGNSLRASVTVKGGTTDVSNKFIDVAASSPITFQIDVHNDEDPAHLLVWNSVVTNFEEGNASLNTEEAGYESPGKGSGNFWGLALNKARVTQSVPSAAKFSEGD